jgi:hypothetical protein
VRRDDPLGDPYEFTAAPGEGGLLPDDPKVIAWIVGAK